MSRTLDELRAQRDAAWARAPRYDARPWSKEQQAAHDGWVDAEVKAAKRHLRELLNSDRYQLKQQLLDAERRIRIDHPHGCRGVERCDCAWAKAWRRTKAAWDKLPPEPKLY